MTFFIDSYLHNTFKTHTFTHTISTNHSVIFGRAITSWSIEGCTESFSVEGWGNIKTRKSGEKTPISLSTVKKNGTAIKPVLCAYVSQYIPTTHVKNNQHTTPQ